MQGAVYCKNGVIFMKLFEMLIEALYTLDICSLTPTLVYASTIVDIDVVRCCLLFSLTQNVGITADCSKRIASHSGT